MKLHGLHNTYVSTWCQPALGAWNQSCFLLSSFLAKSINKGNNQQPESGVWGVSQITARCPKERARLHCEKKWIQVPRDCPMWGRFADGAMGAPARSFIFLGRSDRDVRYWLLCSALVPKCTSDILFTGVKQKELIRWGGGLGRCMGKLELGPEKTGFGEAKERREGGVPWLKNSHQKSGTGECSKDVEAWWLPDKRGLRPRKDAGKDGQDITSLQSCKHQGPWTWFSEPQDRSFGSLWSLHTQDEVDKRSMKVAPRKKKRSRRTVKWVGVWVREARKLERQTVARDIFLFNG